MDEQEGDSKSKGGSTQTPDMSAPLTIAPGTYFKFSAPSISSLESMFWAGGGSREVSDADRAGKGRQAIAEGDSLMAQQKFAAALRRFHEAVWLCPGEAEYHYRLVGAAHQAGQHDLVERHLQEAVRLDPCFAPAHYSLGRMYRLAGKAERAIFHTATTVALAPLDPNYVAEHGAVLLMTGEVEQAWEMTEALAEKAGLNCPALVLLLARIALRLGHEEKALAVVEKSLKCADLPIDREGKPRLQLAAAELLDKLGRYDEAFAYAKSANEFLLMTSPRHDASVFAEMVTKKIAYFTPERLKMLPRASHGDRRPIFIVGMPRSGTTLVEQMLACHPEVCAGGEIELLRTLQWAKGIPDWPNDEPYPQALETLSVRAANHLAERYLSKIRAISADAKFVTDKMPFNLLALEMAELLLPGCHVIYCVRNPLDTGLSCYMTHFSEGNEYKYDLAHIGTCLRYSAQMMEHWKETLSLPILQIRYDELILDTEAQARRMLEFLGLEWEPSCLEFHRNNRSVRTASEDQVRKPIYTKSISRWKFYEGHLGPLIEALKKPVRRIGA